MLPVFESGEVCSPVVSRCGWISVGVIDLLSEHEISGVRVGDTEGVVHAREIGSKK